MNRTKDLQDLGQSLWLDNITREILDDGTLRRYIDEFSITGLTSNPTIFDQAIGSTDAYDESIREKAAAGTIRRSAVRGAGTRRLMSRRGHVPAGIRRDRWRRWLGVDGNITATGH